MLAGLSLVTYRFWTWRADLRDTLQAGSQLASTRLGPIEYAVVGQGTPFLSLHGTPGGYDVALASRRANPAAGDVRTITVSRPGYLRTPLSSGPTFEQQADLIAALLDELRVERVVVVASSGGAYPGMQFALRHPNRCIALILLSPAVGHEPLPEGPPAASGWSQFMEDFSIWAVGEKSGEWFMQGFNANDPVQAAFVKELSTIRSPAALRFEGRRNDLLQRSNPAVDRWMLEEISVPTLIVHGDADENAPYELSARAAARIPGARLVTMEGGDHYIPITRADAVRAAIESFLANPPPRQD